MVTTKTREKQRAYTKEMLALGLGGILAGLCAGGLQLIAGGHGTELAFLSFGSVLGLGASFLDHKEGSSIFRIVLGVLGGLMMLLLLGVHPLFAAAVGGTFLGAAYSLDHGKSTAQRVGVWLAYGASLAAAVYTADVLLTVGFFKSINSVFVQEALRAGIGGAFLMLPAGLKFMEWEGDSVLSEFREARAVMDDKHKAFLDDAATTYEHVREEAEREGHKDVRARAIEIAEEVARGLLALTKRSHELHQTISRTRTQPLEVRITELEDRIRKTRDAALRRELIAALDGVVEQLRTRQRFEAACVRLEARQQRYLTALERLHVTLIQNDSLTAGGEGAISLSLDDLKRLTDEVQWKNLSVDELCGTTSEEGGLEEISGEDDELEALLQEARVLTSDEAQRPSRSTKKEEDEEEMVLVSDEDEHDEEVVLQIDGDDDDEEVVLPSADEEEEQEEESLALQGVDGSLREEMD